MNENSIQVHLSAFEIIRTAFCCYVIFHDCTIQQSQLLLVCSGRLGLFGCCTWVLGGHVQSSPSPCGVVPLSLESIGSLSPLQSQAPPGCCGMTNHPDLSPLSQGTGWRTEEVPWAWGFEFPLYRTGGNHTQVEKDVKPTAYQLLAKCTMLAEGLILLMWCIVLCFTAGHEP